MSILHVLLPPLARLAEAPVFMRWLARGDRLPDLREPRATALRERFQFIGDAIPAAALRHHCHTDAAGSGVWLCADPAYVRSEATGARLMAWPIADLGGDEALQLAGALRGMFEAAALQLCVDTPTEWCLLESGAASPADFVQPADALGVDLLECLPRGDGGRAWRRLFNEGQIVLHAHPVNAARVAAGKLPVNALWFWGAGRLPDTVETGLQLVASTDDVLRGLAKMAGAVRVEPLPCALEAAEARGDTLLDLDPFGTGESIAEWHAGFRRWLHERRFDAIELIFAGGERFHLRRSHRLRFWRRG